MSVKIFKIKITFMHILDKIKEFLKKIAEFFHLVSNHPTTEKVSYHVKKVTRKVSTNISDNNKNWKHRISSSPSFEISEEDG